MGYEKRMHVAKIGQPTEVEAEGKKLFARFLMPIATFECGKAGWGAEALDELEEKSHVPEVGAIPVYWYTTGEEETLQVEDKYGNLCYPVSIQDVLTAIDKDAMGSEELFHTVLPMYAFLQAMPKDLANSHCAVFYGH